MSALGVSSGVVVQASGWTPTARTMFLEPLPQSLYGSGDATPVNSFTGTDSNKSLNVNISGGTLSVAVNPFGLQSGTMVIISGGPTGLSGLNVIASVTTTLAGYQSGTLVGISGGQLALSGLNVITTVNPFGLQSGTMVLISGGQLALSGLVVLNSGQTLTVLGHVVSGGIQVSGTVAISNTGFQVSGTVAVSGVVAIGSGSVAILSGAISIQSGIISISGGVQVSGTIAVSGIVQIGSGSVNVLSGLESVYEWPSYSLATFWSGPAGIGMIGLAHAGGAAGKSGQVIELLRLEVGIWSSGNINRTDIYRVNDATIAMSGPAGTITAFYSGNAVSLVSGFVETSSGLVSGAWSGATPIETMFLEANSSGFMHNYVYEFNQTKGQSLQVVSGQGVLVIMTSGIGVGEMSLDWIERYLS